MGQSKINMHSYNIMNILKTYYVLITINFSNLGYNNKS